MVRILLVDDHVGFREPLAFMLGLEDGFEVVAEATTVAEAKARLAGVELAIIDLNLPDGSGAEVIEALHAVDRRAMALLLTASTAPAEIAPAVEAGAAGVLHKSARLHEIIDAARRLSRGEFLLGAAEAVAMVRLVHRQRDQDRAAQAKLDALTPREWEVLRALAEGLTDKEIADRLFIGPGTARTHMMSILRKLDVDSRLQALVFAVRHGAIAIT